MGRTTAPFAPAVGFVMKSVVGVLTGSTNVKYFLVLKYAVVEMRNLCGFMTYF